MSLYNSEFYMIAITETSLAKSKQITAVIRCNQSEHIQTYVIAGLNFKCHLDHVTVLKFTRLCMASPRLETEAGRWHEPNKTPVEERKCFHCNSLEDDFHFKI